MRFENLVGAAMRNLLFRSDMVLRELALVTEDDVVIKSLINHCLDRLTVVLNSLTAPFFAVYIWSLDTFLLVGCNDHGLIEFAAGANRVFIAIVG